MPLTHLPRGWTILAASGIAVPHTGNTNETVLATIPVPGGAMGLNGRLRLTCAWSYTNSVNNKTARVRFGGAAGTIHHSITFTTTANYKFTTEIINVNSLSSQKSNATMTGGWGTSTGSLLTGNIDTSVAQDLVIAGTLANSGETISLEHYLVELLNQG